MTTINANTPFEITVCEYVWAQYGKAISKVANANEKTQEKLEYQLSLVNDFIIKYNVPSLESIHRNQQQQNAALQYEEEEAEN